MLSFWWHTIKPENNSFNNNAYIYFGEICVALQDLFTFYQKTTDNGKNMMMKFL